MGFVLDRGHESVVYSPRVGPKGPALVMFHIIYEKNLY